MTTNLKDFFIDLSLDGFFTQKLNFGVTMVLTDKEIQKYRLEPVSDKQSIYCSIIANESDLKLREKYNVIYTRQDPASYIKSEVEIDFLSINRGESTTVIPARVNGIIKLKFKSPIPKIIKSLKEGEDDNFDPKVHKFVYFTTEETISEILILLDKQEDPVI